MTRRWDGRVDADMRPWRDVIDVEEDLDRGGFRGRVRVSAAEASPQTKQIFDFLHGHDAAGKEVVVSWAPFKAEPSAAPREPAPREVPDRPPRK